MTGDNDNARFYRDSEVARLRAKARGLEYENRMLLEMMNAVVLGKTAVTAPCGGQMTSATAVPSTGMFKMLQGFSQGYFSGVRWMLEIDA